MVFLLCCDTLDGQEKRMPSFNYEISLFSFPLLDRIQISTWCAATFDIVVKL